MFFSYLIQKLKRQLSPFSGVVSSLVQLQRSPQETILKGFRSRSYGKDVVVGMYWGRYDSMQSLFGHIQTSRKQSLGFMSLSVLQSCLTCFHSLHRWRLSFSSRKFSRLKCNVQPSRVDSRVPIVINTSSEEEIPKETSCKHPRIAELTRNQLPTEQLSWEDVERLTCHLVHKIKEEQYIFDAILAITRGGLIPATIAAETLELRTVFVATVIFYGDRGDPFYGLAEPRILFFPEKASLEGRKVLVID
ncbi:purine phosphoribosyltransferase-like protein, partial [Galdieria sulphuraria]